MEPFPEEGFQFACHPGVKCFTECCGDLSLILTPYDILRLRRKLEISSRQFLDRYTVEHKESSGPFPLLLLRMGEDPRRRCPFLGGGGCSVYEDRPGACRLYPVGRASGGGDADVPSTVRYFLVKEPHCKGFEEGRLWSIEEWLRDQGADEYERMNQPWIEILTSSNPRKDSLSQKQLQMFFLTCYNLERFRDFLFQSGFLSRFELEADTLEELRRRDEALYLFGMRWLRFALYAEPTLQVRR